MGAFDNWGQFNTPFSSSMDFGTNALGDANAAPMVFDTSSVGSDGFTGGGGLGGVDLSGGAMGTGGLFGSGGALGTGMNGFQLGGDILGGLKTLGGLYLGIRQLGLANKQFRLSRDFANANLTNQTKSYNTALTDRENSRAAMEGLTPQQAQSYITSNSLSAPHLGG